MRIHQTLKLVFALLLVSSAAVAQNLRIGHEPESTSVAESQRDDQVVNMDKDLGEKPDEHAAAPVHSLGKLGEKFREHAQQGGKYEHIQKFVNHREADAEDATHDKRDEGAESDSVQAPHADPGYAADHPHKGAHHPKHHKSIAHRLRHVAHRVMGALGLTKHHPKRSLGHHDDTEHGEPHGHSRHPAPQKPDGHPAPPSHQPRDDAPPAPPAPPAPVDLDVDDVDADAAFVPEDPSSDGDEDDEEEDEDFRHGYDHHDHDHHDHDHDHHKRKHHKDHHHRHHDEGIGGVIVLALIITGIVLAVRRCRRRRRAWKDMSAAVQQLQQEVMRLRHVTGLDREVPAGTVGVGAAAPQHPQPQPQPQMRQQQPVQAYAHRAPLYPNAQSRMGYMNNEEREDAPLLHMNGHTTS